MRPKIKEKGTRAQPLKAQLTTENKEKGTWAGEMPQPLKVGLTSKNIKEMNSKNTTTRKRKEYTGRGNHKYWN